MNRRELCWLFLAGLFVQPPKPTQVRVVLGGTDWQSLATLSGTSKSYSDSAIVQGQAYDYRIVSVGPNGQSLSNIATAVT